MQKRIRLKGFNYKGFHRYFVTITTDQHSRYFEATLKGRTTFEMVVKYLREISKNIGFKVWVYACMPDHIHFLVEGTAQESDFRKFMSLFKQKSAYIFKQKFGMKLWQENYYEHVLRKDEDVIGVIRYILNNPVRANLVDHAFNYPYSGSFEVDIREILS